MKLADIKSRISGKSRWVGRREPTADNTLRKASSRAPFDALGSNDMPPQVQSAVTALMDELDRLHSELDAANRRVDELESVADEDPLLPVLNRRGFVRELERTLAYVKRHGGPSCLIYVDLDDFKSVNDVYGHAAGDAALRHVCDIIIGNVRRSDIVGRLGGDEFAVVLQKAGLDNAEAKVAQLASQLAAVPFSFEGVAIALAITTGVTELVGGDRPKDALARADRAMYARKPRRAPNAT